MGNFATTLSCLVFLILFGCSQSADSDHPKPTAKQPLRFQVEPDASDYVSWAVVGGIQGHWSSTTLRGDGSITHQGDGPVPAGGVEPKPENLSPEETRKRLQAAVDAGLFSLESRLSGEADGSSVGIEAEIDGTKVSVSWSGMVEDPTWKAVLAAIQGR